MLNSLYETDVKYVALITEISKMRTLATILESQLTLNSESRCDFIYEYFTVIRQNVNLMMTLCHYTTTLYTCPQKAGIFLSSRFILSSSLGLL